MTNSRTLASSSRRPSAMVATGGWIMTGHFGGNWQLTHHADGTIWSLDSKRPRCMVRRLHNPHFVHSADHTRPQCALTYLYPQPLRPPPQQRQAGTRINQGAEICRSWNKGTCIIPGRCWYRHICLRCQLPHRARDCPKTLEQRPQVQLTGPQPRQ